MTRRRSVLRLAACCTGLALAAPRALLAAAPTERRLVVVILRGAMDGLGAVPAYADPAYATARGPLALTPRDGLLDLDGFFALHPALPTLAGWYKAGELAVLHATATPYRERSHFDGQDLLENGTPRPGGAASGWLNRALSLMPAKGDRLGLAMAPTAPLVIRGDVPVQGWTPRVLPAAKDEMLATLASLYAADPLLGPAFAEGLASRGMEAGGPGVPPVGPEAFVTLAGEAGKLLAGPAGFRVAALELDGWDTHQGQGTREGRLARQLGILDRGLGALRNSLGDAWRETALIATTEFGRTVPANGTGGTDHGTASAAFVAGGTVAGGRVLARWPGLAPDRLYQGRDLAPTTDLRSPLKALLTAHLGLPADDVGRLVFPESAGVPSIAELVVRAA